MIHGQFRERFRKRLLPGWHNSIPAQPRPPSSSFGYAQPVNAQRCLLCCSVCIVLRCSLSLPAPCCVCVPCRIVDHFSPFVDLHSPFGSHSHLCFAHARLLSSLVPFSSRIVCHLSSPDLPIASHFPIHPPAEKLPHVPHLPRPLPCLTQHFILLHVSQGTGPVSIRNWPLKAIRPSSHPQSFSFPWIPLLLPLPT